MSLADRQSSIELVKEARASGAGRAASCAVLVVSLRTLERWEKQPDQGDQRRGPDTVCGHALSEKEKQAIVAVCNRSDYRDLSPWQIVARLADQGCYLGSQSSFYRVLKQNDQLSHRQQSKPPVHSRPKDLTARNPNEVWSWDITYLNTAIRGTYYYLYLVEDIFSRMIVGWAVEEEQSTEHSARLIDWACQEHGIARGQLTLHADNGAPVKGATLLATLERLGIAPSFSRPRVSDDNPYSESLFKTLKYRPSYPETAFSGIEQAREWVSRFVKWYNTEHLHSAIRFVTPSCRHLGLDKAILTKRAAVYENAKRLNPRRWSGPTRNWSPITEVYLNPKKPTMNTKVEIPIDPGRGHRDCEQRPTDSAVSGSMEQSGHLGGVNSKNDAHSCPTANASQPGRGRGRGENRLNHDRSKPSRRRSELRCKVTRDYPALEN